LTSEPRKRGTPTFETTGDGWSSNDLQALPFAKLDQPACLQLTKDMELTDSQKDKVRDWMREGMTLAELQGKLQSEFGLGLTYMETRFLVDDLDVTLADPAPEPETAAPAADPGEPESGPDPDAAEMADWEDAGMDPELAAEAVKVSLDKITRPGSIVSGDVVFANGKKLAWQLDQSGRIGLIPGTEEYRPSQDEIEAFQIALQEELQKAGF
jgi:hypothetical protein